MDYWDGDDSIGLSLVLIPVTAIWYLVRGAPRARRENVAERRRQSEMQTSGFTSGLMAVMMYVLGIFYLVILAGVVVGIVVFIF